MGYTLRFPRCRFIYWDRQSRTNSSGEEHKDRDMWNCVSACTYVNTDTSQLSFDEFTVLMQQPKKRYTDDDGGTWVLIWRSQLTGSSRKKRRVTTTRRKVELFESFRGQKLSNALVEDSIFTGMTFCKSSVEGPC